MHCCVNAPRWCLSTGGYHEQPYCEFALAFCSSADSSPVRNVMLAVCNWLRSTVMFVCWLLEIATEVSFFRPNGKRNKIMYEVAYWAYWNHPESHGRLGYTCYWEDVFLMFFACGNMTRNLERISDTRPGKVHLWNLVYLGLLCLTTRLQLLVRTTLPLNHRLICEIWIKCDQIGSGIWGPQFWHPQFPSRAVPGTTSWPWPKRGPAAHQGEGSGTASDWRYCVSHRSPRLRPCRDHAAWCSNNHRLSRVF